MRWFYFKNKTFDMSHQNMIEKLDMFLALLWLSPFRSSSSNLPVVVENGALGLHIFHILWNPFSSFFLRQKNFNHIEHGFSQVFVQWVVGRHNLSNLCWTAQSKVSTEGFLPVFCMAKLSTWNKDQRYEFADGASNYYASRVMERD